MSGRITAITAVESNPDIIFIGTASGGAWKSENGGVSFTPIFENEQAISVGDIAINQKNPAEIWIGTGEGNPRNSLNSGYGIYKSIDGGKSWKYMGLGETRNIHRVIIHPDNPNTVFAGAIGAPWSYSQDRGVYKTTDGGETWRKILFVDEKTGVGDMVMDPQNPNKLIAAMWEHRRWPWYFNSGGPGSGIFISYDGGDSWQKKTSDDGLPAGNLGRIGLAIAPTNPQKVYALVEAKKNGFYKSEDGGESWKLVSTENIGGRPFYYADIFVDTEDENRIYNLYTFVDYSKDGGKTFERLVNPGLIHVDNHAWYNHPKDASFMILGNDGGLAISRDRGVSWRAVENLPIGQFYHIKVDDEVPYNVYGGMQDNGSWRGPSQVWRVNGIRNLYWNRIGGGDGFDATPDPKDSRYGYSLSQGGSIMRYDLETGHQKRIIPYIPGVELRYNWNAAVAIDPVDKETLYLGSQYLMKSIDNGSSWELISPDLTTNDPEKQKQLTTGGLTTDNSGAENYTTILSIAPSPVKQEIIWVGTDDGNLQLTTDGGGTWSNLTSKLPGAPAGGWVAQIQASTYNENEAFVVLNNYRQGDWSPYLYRTTNLGKSWTRIVDDNDVWGYCLSVIQDPVSPNLIFLGTENGMYFSLDNGSTWNQWDKGFPAVPTMDLQIQTREGDLAIGTFGRSIWILDDIQPLRELASNGYDALLKKDLHVFKAPNAWLAFMGQANGYRSTGDGFFAAENRTQGSLISYYLKESKEKEKAKIQVFDEANSLIRSFTHTPEKGINRVDWDLEVNGVRPPNVKKPKDGEYERGGYSVAPGKYKVVISYGELEGSTEVEVKIDPNITTTTEEISAKTELFKRHYGNISKVTQRVDQIREAQEVVAKVQKAISDQSDKEQFSNLSNASDSVKKALEKFMDSINAPEIQGFTRTPDLLSTQLQMASGYLQSSLYPLTKTQKDVVEDVEKKANMFISEVDKFFETEWSAFKGNVENSKLSFFGN